MDVALLEIALLASPDRFEYLVDIVAVTRVGLKNQRRRRDLAERGEALADRILVG
jgi:hypothetical protein